MYIKQHKLIISGIKLLLIFMAFLYAIFTFAGSQGLVNGALLKLGKTFYYDPAYVVMTYPYGDIPMNRGVCTDVVIRAFRHDHTDLQEKVHLDMKLNFNHYPQLWGFKKTNTNINHRRVPNLETWFQR